MANKTGLLIVDEGARLAFGYAALGMQQVRATNLGSIEIDDRGRIF